jgi:ligand-binding sensor domain-containing protein
MYRRPLHASLIMLLSTLLFSHLAPSQTVSWIQTRGPSGGNITALAVTPAGTVLAGTDEGVHRSTDGGLSWKWASATMTYRRISALEQDSSGAMIAGTSEGKIYKSSDDGLSWQEIPGQGSASITALCSGDSAALWVSRWNTGVSRTTNGGTHWQTLDSGLTDKFVLSLLVGDSGFALAGTMTGIFRTTGSVVSWTPAANGPSNSPVYSLARHPGGNLFAATTNGIFRSTNRGDDWIKADNASARSIVIDDSGIIITGMFSGDARRSTDGGTLWGTASVSPGLAVSAMAPSHSGLVYAGSLGMGVYRSTDSGITWVPRHDGLVASTVLALLRAPDNSVYAATDGSGLFRTTDGGTSWVPVPTAPVIFNFYCLATDDSGKILAGTWGNGLLRQSGPGPAWQSIAYGYFYCIETSPGGVILAGNDVGKIIHSTDYGQTWSADSVGTEPVLSVADGGDGYLYAGTFQTGVYRSSDGGKIWSQKISGLSNLIVRTLLTRQGGVLLAGTDGGLFKTSDRGESWTPVTTGLFSLRAMLPIGENWIVAAGWKGLSLSSNGGNSWSPVNDGLWPPDVRSIAGDAAGYLYAGTANAGVFKSVVPTAIGVEGRPRVPAAYSLEQNYPNPFNPTTTIKYGLPNTSRARLTVYDILGREVSVLVNERREAGLHEVTFDGSNLASGVYFYRLQAGDFVSTKRMVALK